MSDRAPQTAVSDQDYRALANFRWGIRRFVRAAEEAARAAGLEPQQHQVMLAIRGAERRTDVSIRYLAERMQLRHHSVVELVDRLEAGGYVQRRRHAVDRRVVLVDLSAKGRAALRRISGHTRREIRSLAPSLLADLQTLLRASPDKK